MCIPLELSQNVEKSVLTQAFHPDVKNFQQAESKLAGKIPGTFLTFSAKGQNFCSAVGKDGKVLNNPFRWDVSGGWYNYSAILYPTEKALLDHLVEDQDPIPLYN